MAKPHLEFHAIDLSEGWRQVGPNPNVQEKVLAGNLDEIRKTGSVTRLLRMLPGTTTTEVLVHDFWEEVFVVSGDYIVLDPATLEPAQIFPAGAAYACRPPHKEHGPFATEHGVLLFEVRYYP